MNYKLILAYVSFAAFLLVPAPSLRADVLDHWTTNQITTNSFGLRHVVYGNGRYVAVGEFLDDGGIYTSEDGLNWTLRFSDMSSWGLTLSFSSNHFAGVGGWGMVDVSTNGTNWTSSFLPYGFVNLFAPSREIVYGNNLYVTVGDTNGVGNILISPDGITWTSRSITPAPGGRISSVAYGLGKFVAVGDNDGLEYTSTGLFWTRSSIPGGSQVSYANGLFFVPLNTKTNLLSTDGINWTAINTGITNSFGRVIYGNGLFMSARAGSLVTSIDGTNWISYPQSLPGDGAYDVSLATDGARLVTVRGVDTNNGLFMACNSFVFTSDVLVSVRTTNAPSQEIVLSGLVGRNYQIQSADVLTAGSNNWRTNVTLQLANTTCLWTDATATNAQRFYRAVLLP